MGKSVDLKVVIVGACGVGKTSLIRRYKEKTFDPMSEATIGAALYMKRWGSFNIAIWDTAGQEKFFSGTGLGAHYFRGAKVVILAFDMSCADSYRALWDRFIPLVCSYAEEDCFKVLVGCKLDLTTTSSRAVSHETATAKANELNPSLKVGAIVPYFETSSLSGENVDMVFEYIFKFFFPCANINGKGSLVEADFHGSKVVLHEDRNRKHSTTQNKCCKTA